MEIFPNEKLKGPGVLIWSVAHVRSEESEKWKGQKWRAKTIQGNA